MRTAMYTLDIFTETDRSTLKALLQAHPLGTLISLKDGVPQADHLPFYLIDDGANWTLMAHFAKANPLASYVHEQDVLVIFTGEQGYISPNWYPSKHIHHRHVPTWNYQVLHLRGKACLFTDTKSCLRAVGTLTNIHEKNESTPWAIKDAPRDYIQAELADVVALRIDVIDIEGKFKLSQNRDDNDFAQVVQSLHDKGAVSLATAINRTREP